MKMKKEQMVERLRVIGEMVEEISEILYKEEINQGRMNSKYDEIIDLLDGAKTKIRKASLKTASLK